MFSVYRKMVNYEFRDVSRDYLGIVVFIGRVTKPVEGIATL